MKFMKRALLIFLSCILVVAGLTGCSNGTNSSQTDSGQSASGESSESGDKVKLEFLQGKAESVDAYNVIIEKFMEEYPNIEVEQINLPETYTVLTTRLSSGDYPDLFNHFPLRTDFDVLVESGQILDISEEPYLANVNQEILEMSRKEDGNIYSLPLTQNTMGIYYNNEILERVGGEIPKTYEELIALLDRVKEEPDGKFLFACKDSWTLGQMMDRRLGQLFINSGTDFDQTFKDIGAGNLNAADIPEISQASEKMLQLFKYAQNDPFGTSFTQMCDDFATGKGIAFFQGTWAYPNIKKANPDLDFSFAAFPADQGQNSTLSTNIDIGLCIPSGSAHVEEAKIFLEFISQHENAQIFNDLDGSLSLINGVENTVEEFDTVFNAINQGDVYEMMSNYWPNGYMTRLQDLVSAMLLNNDPETFYKDLDSLTVELYNQ